MRRREWMRTVFTSPRSNRASVGQTADNAGPTLIYFIDVYWCDASGTFLQGWAIVEDIPLASVAVRIGPREVITQRSQRLDILPHYPAAVDAERAGFSVYVPGRPSDHVVLVGVLTDGREILTILDLPDHPLPIVADEVESFPGSDEFPGDAPDGPILAIGIRAATAELLRSRLAILGDREVIGFDIHPGIGVDVVGDAHRLSSYFPKRHFAAIYTSSLLEHLSTPWLFALECAKVLVPGGRMLHELPWLWPSHSQPNDFWRMSPAALSVLFGEQLGLRTISRGTTGSGRVVPTPASRAEQLMMPTVVSALFSWIQVEKVDDRARSISWPYDAEAGAALSSEYPVESLSLAPRNF
jgi:SAM-dependent methyltransferase